MALQFTSDTGKLIATEADFAQVVQKLRNIVLNVTDQSQEARAGLQVQGMDKFQQTINLWNDEINQLSGELKNLNDRNQQVAQQQNHANNQTADVSGRSWGF